MPELRRQAVLPGLHTFAEGIRHVALRQGHVHVLEALHGGAQFLDHRFGVVGHQGDGRQACRRQPHGDDAAPQDTSHLVILQESRAGPLACRYPAQDAPPAGAAGRARRAVHPLKYSERAAFTPALMAWLAHRLARHGSPKPPELGWSGKTGEQGQQQAGAGGTDAG